MKYDITKELDIEFALSVKKVKEELKKEGFGVLTEIDVKDTMKQKLNEEYENYTILGACNPPFAHKALTSEKKIGLFLPCNVIVYSEKGKSVVSAVDPRAMMAPVQNKDLIDLGEEVYQKLKRVIDNL